MKVKWVACVLCVLVTMSAFGKAPALVPDEPIDANIVAIPTSHITILAADASEYSLTVVEEVTLADGFVIPVGDPLYLDDVVVSGMALNDGDTTVWIADADGDEYQVLPGMMLEPGCMTFCTCSKCPDNLGCYCRAEMFQGKNCCLCSCVSGPYPESCSCRVADPA